MFPPLIGLFSDPGEVAGTSLTSGLQHCSETQSKRLFEETTPSDMNNLLSSKGHH